MGVWCGERNTRTARDWRRGADALPRLFCQPSFTTDPKKHGERSGLSCVTRVANPPPGPTVLVVDLPYPHLGGSPAKIHHEQLLHSVPSSVREGGLLQKAYWIGSGLGGRSRT